MKRRSETLPNCSNHEQLPKRKRNRWANFDYSSVGSYFITLCCDKRRKILWEDPKQRFETAEEIRLSKVGLIADQGIRQIEEKYPGVKVAQYCIMPDHVHMILFLPSTQQPGIESVPDLSVVISKMKTWVTKQAGQSIWQRSYYDRVIRNEKEYGNISRYIANNPYNMDQGENSDILDLFEDDLLDM